MRTTTTRRPRTRAVACALLGLSLLAGCSTDGDSAGDAAGGDAQDAGQGAQATDDQATDDQATDDQGTDGATTPATSPAATGTAAGTPSGTGAQGTPGGAATGDAGGTQGEVVDVSGAGLQDRHPNGTVLTVRTVQVNRTGIVVGLDVVNGYTDAISLNGAGMFLVDDLDNGYLLKEPAQNTELAVAPGSELTGDVVFLGQVPPDATSLTLKTGVYEPEDPIDTTDRYDSDTTPDLLVEGIPLS